MTGVWWSNYCSDNPLFVAPFWSANQRLLGVRS